jgi:molecular chaperone GrpE (heat shock protein)
MNERVLPKLVKWPFYLGDAFLLLAAIWILNKAPHPLGPWPLLFLVVCVAAGAWVCVTPFLIEYRSAMRLAESDSLTTAVQQMRNLHSVSDQITVATAQWQTVQEHSTKTVAEARQIAERMTTEARAFAEFMQKANDSEKAHLRLETEKLRRAESDWLEVLVRVLDNVYALYQAAVRSGQPTVKQQLTNFQTACRDAVRRIGLVPLEAQTGEPFDERRHQLLNPETKPSPEARVAETVATGYSFQGQLLRRCLVNVTEQEAQTPEDETAFHLEMLDTSKDADSNSNAA